MDLTVQPWLMNLQREGLRGQRGLCLSESKREGLVGLPREHLRTRSGQDRTDSADDRRA